MKKDVFNQYVERVCELFGISTEDMFSKSKCRDVVDARQLLYFLCSERKIAPSYIQKFMKDRGYKIGHSTVLHGVSVVKKKLEEDKDYVAVVKDMERAVYM
jgi:chromosomal replication initiator protein